MGDMDLIPRQTKPHSLAEGSDVGRRFLSKLGPRASTVFQGLLPPWEPVWEGGAAEDAWFHTLVKKKKKKW